MVILWSLIPFAPAKLPFQQSLRFAQSALSIQGLADLHLFWPFLHLYQSLQVVDGLHANYALFLSQQEKKRGAPSSLRHRRRRSPAAGNGSVSFF